MMYGVLCARKRYNACCWPNEHSDWTKKDFLEKTTFNRKQWTFVYFPSGTTRWIQKHSGDENKKFTNEHQHFTWRVGDFVSYHYIIIPPSKAFTAEIIGTRTRKRGKNYSNIYNDKNLVLKNIWLYNSSKT